MKNDTGIVNIHGKQYHTVAKRVQDFRDKFAEYSLTTEVVFRDDDCVVMKASIADADGRIIATGHAEEQRASSQINRSSALENAETSAIGRALAAFGIGGTEFASANEVENAVHQQSAKELPTGPINDTTRDWLQAQIDATGKPVGDFCEFFKVTSLKDIKYEDLPEAKVWLKKQRKAA